MSAALHRHDRVASTQDDCFRLAADGAPDGTAVTADVQEGGRGSRGNRWASPEGGLWLSVLRRPASAEGVELASLRAGLAVAAALGTLDGLALVQLKWPNDLLVDGRKVGGILVEAQWTGDRLAALVIGVGINVRNTPPADARWPATSLATWLPAVQVEAVRQLVLPALRAVQLAAPQLAASELAAFAARDALAGRDLAAPEAGIAAGLTADGALRVRRPDGTMHRVRTGPVVPA